MRGLLLSSFGAGLCITSAAALTLLHRSSLRTFLPFLFLAMIIFVAIRFGTLAGVVGTIAAALIFAGFLFEPRMSLVVRDSAAKNNLVWMIIAGIAVSDLLGHSAKGTPGNKDNIP